MSSISDKIKREILDFVINEPSFLGNYDQYDGILTFLNSIWDLRKMKSEDLRYDNAYEDIRQHIVNNNDWDYRYLFEERLGVIKDTGNKFNLFIEKVIHPTVRKNQGEIYRYVSDVNSILNKSNYRLILTDYFEELPVYSIRESESYSDLPLYIKKNDIPIYVDPHKDPGTYPFFVLISDYWDDYGAKTTFDLRYIQGASESFDLGKIKILKRDNDSSTKDVLPAKFTALLDEFCSLGQSEEFYFKLKSLLSENFQSFLLGMRDCALFPKIQEEFENDGVFKTSLIRDNEVERLARTLRFEIENIKPEEYFRFNYTCTPPFAENKINLNFNFRYKSEFEHRMYAIIGKNGTGKTQILSSLAHSLSKKDSSDFSPKKPMFSKIFTVSYSFFDTFNIPKRDASFNYIYCGLKKSKDDWKTRDDLLLEFYESAERIKDRGLVEDWYKILKTFFSFEFLETVFERDELKGEYVFLKEKFSQKNNWLSSGQKIVLFVITQILCHIRFDSLVLFDEPETHLHPNAIRALMNTLFELTKKFESFCILATHSPLIIQEIPARNIFITDREDNFAIIRSLENESLGQNLTVITQEIFGNREVPQHFVKLIGRLVNSGKTYAEIVNFLKTDELPITSNINLYIKSLLEDR